MIPAHACTRTETHTHTHIQAHVICKLSLSSGCVVDSLISNIIDCDVSTHAALQEVPQKTHTSKIHTHAYTCSMYTARHEHDFTCVPLKKRRTKYAKGFIFFFMTFIVRRSFFLVFLKCWSFIKYLLILLFFPLA